MAKQGHKSTDNLSQKAWDVIKQGFAAKHTYRAIVKAVHAATGERVAERTLARRAVEWRQENLSQEMDYKMARAMVKAVREEVPLASEQAAALLADAFARRKKQPTVAEGLMAEKIQLQHGELAVKQKQLDFERERFAWRREIEKAKRTADRALKAGEKSGSIPVEVMAEIKETLYGLTA